MSRKGLFVLFSLWVSACAERPVPTGPAPAWMDRAVFDQVAPFGPHQLVGDIFRGMTLDEDRGVRWQIQLERDRCYAFSGVGSETVGELRLDILDPTGQRLFSTTSKRRVFKGFCVDGRVYSSPGSGWGVWQNRPRLSGLRLAQTLPGIYEFELKSTEGYGHVELGVFIATGALPAPPHGAAPPPSPPPAPPHGAAPPPAPPPAATH